MTLTVAAADGALVFRSERYFVEWFGRRLHLPGWLTPGALTVTHADAGAAEPTDAFRFTLEIRHPLFGRLISQEAVFRDAEPAERGKGLPSGPRRMAPASRRRSGSSGDREEPT